MYCRAARVQFYMNTTMQRVGPCSKCKRDAAWNTPCIDGHGNLWCDDCAKRQPGTLFIGVRQHLGEHGFQRDQHETLVLDGVVLWGRTVGRMCWLDGGRTSYPLTLDEQRMDPKDLLFAIVARVKTGHARCSECSVDIVKTEGRRTLFAGLVCEPCHDKHVAKLDAQRRAGHVCGMCRRPYGDCCC